MKKMVENMTKEGFSTSLPYWELPKETILKVALGDAERINIAMETISSSSYFSIKINSKAGRMLFEKAFSITYKGIERIKYKDTQRIVDYVKFEIDYHFPDLVKLLEVIQEGDC